MGQRAMLPTKLLLLLTFVFWPSRCSGGGGGGWFTTDLRDISQCSYYMPGPGLPHPAGDVPGVQGGVVGENLIIISVAVPVNCSSCIFTIIEGKAELQLFTKN